MTAAAATSFERAARRKPDSELSLIYLASAYGHLGELEKADEAIFMLADMYRLVLDFTSQHNVSFEDEWHLMETYLKVPELSAG